MLQVVDGDSHFMEPLDLYERHIDPALRDRAVKLVTDPATAKPAMLADNKPMKLRDVEELLGLLAGDDKFFIGSDYPHAEGFVHPVAKARDHLKDLPAASIDKILSTNARNFYRI